MEITETGLPGLRIVQLRAFTDDRGSFFEAWNAAEAAAAGLRTDIVQINQSTSKRGVFRGLHFQAPPHDQTKLLRCASGVLLDMVVDIRRGSPAYGKSFSIVLSADDLNMLYVPSGFAHGMYAMTSGCVLQYLVGKSGYVKEAEGGLRYDDPTLGIDWAAITGGQAPIVNDRDRNLPKLADLESPFVYEEEKR